MSPGPSELHFIYEIRVNILTNMKVTPWLVGLKIMGLVHSRQAPPGVLPPPLPSNLLKGEGIG